jgi:ABC-type sugar transport system substrate-binding protein
MEYPRTPDGRYMVVRGRLWRVANPNLAPEESRKLVSELMNARRQVKAAMAAQDGSALAAARSAVNAAKVALGERGPVWWHDGAEDFNRHMVKNTPYRQWYEQLVATRT